MQKVLDIRWLWLFGLLASTATGFGDGMVFPEVYRPKVEIPSQQALLHFSQGTETLVIETSFIGEGTNFGWVVPLPSPPKVTPASEGLFDELQAAFEPRFIHSVHAYYAGVLFLFGLTYLGWRALKDEASLVSDLPLCVLLAAGAGLVGKHVAFGVVGLGFTLCIRVFARSSSSYALILLVGTSFCGMLAILPGMHGFGLVQTLGSDGPSEVLSVPGVTVVSVQRAGLFDSTTIRGRTPEAVLNWLEQNGYEAPASAKPVISDYLNRDWVFVASKTRRTPGAARVSTLHPLAFTFATEAPIYPTKLTAVSGKDCLMHLYVFGDRRAAAPGFDAVRCDRLATRQAGETSRGAALQISNPEILGLMGNSTVGTKLSGKLSPREMASDVKIGSRFFWSTGRRVYSQSGALTIALNVSLPLAGLVWLLVAMGVGMNERQVFRWRVGSLVAAAAIGTAAFLLIPKVAVEQVSPDFSEHMAGNSENQPS